MAEQTVHREEMAGEAAGDPDLRRAERMTALILGIFLPVLLAVIALALGGLLLAPKDDSTLGLMRALVFRCH
ncbi:MAG: hypothetical protein AAF563_24040 [Pseudomonadota bacterium]